ncbi:hypothetical protein DL546_003907 [Coniochaeta pulveracea]|uniref:Uncharacterized protein n=1 Tax=Coniochaeta pulveracea TaxID=177199 RepID=A0A420YIS9_9PEZI|nr:hypothetical protein DL546_003907 [Coniochaeta pulveracea]
MSLPQGLAPACETCLNCHQVYTLAWFKNQLTPEEAYAIIYGSWQPELYPNSDTWLTCVKCRLLAYAHDQGFSIFQGSSPEPIHIPTYTAAISSPPQSQQPLLHCQQCPGKYTLPHFKAELTPDEMGAVQANLYTWFTSDLPLTLEEQARMLMEAFAAWPVEMEWQYEKVVIIAPPKLESIEEYLEETGEDNIY